MAPTINNGAATGDKRPVRPGDRRSDFICRIKYCNTLPDIPFDTKFIQYPFNPNRFIEYKQTSLEKNYKYEVLTEHDLGVNIDLINKDAYAIDYNAVLDPKDEKLLEEDNFTPQDSKRSRHHARSVSWLRRTEYISTEQTRFQPQTMEKVEAKVGFSIKKSFKDEVLYMDHTSQIKAIEKTFEDVQKPITVHPSKPNVTPVQVLDVFPDFKMWKYPFAQVLFDSDPARPGRSVPEQNEEMSQAMIRGVMDEEGNQFVAYFLPTEETLNKRKEDFINKIEYVDDEEYEYKIARDYNWNVKNKASKGYEENYLFVMRNDGVYYDELETRVRLTKRRQPGQALNFTRLVLKHRPTDAAEFKNHRMREKQLEPPGEEDEEEEEEEEEEGDDGKDEGGEKNEEEQNEEGGKKSADEAQDSENEGKRSDDEDRKSDEGRRSGSDSDDDDNRSQKSDGSDRSDRSDKSRKSNTSDRSDTSRKSNASERSDTSRKSNATDRSDGSRKSDASDRSNRSGKSHVSNQSDRSGESVVSNKSNKSGKSDASSRSSKSGRSDKSYRTSKSNKSVSSDKSDQDDDEDEEKKNKDEEMETEDSS